MESTQGLHGRIVAISLSDRKGVKKSNVKKARLLEDHGMENDAMPTLGTLFGIGGLLGMYFRAKTQKYISEKWVKIVLGIIVFTIASRYI